MEKLAQAGNTYYIFDPNGEGMSFNSMGRVISEVKFANVCLSLRNVQDVTILSILGMPGVDRCDVYFDGMAGVADSQYMGLVTKAKSLSNMGLVPLRVPRTEQPGLLQVLFVIRAGSVSRDDISGLFGIKEWRPATACPTQ